MASPLDLVSLLNRLEARLAGGPGGGAGTGGRAFAGVEEALAQMADRFRAVGSQARTAVADLAGLHAQRAAGAPVADWQLHAATVRQAGAGAQAASLGTSGVELTSLLTAMKGLTTEANTRLLPRLRDLTTVAADLATAEKKQAEGAAEVARLQRNVAEYQARGAPAHVITREQQKLETARTQQAGLEETTGALRGQYGRGSAGLQEEVQAAQPGMMAQAGAAISGLAGAAGMAMGAFTSVASAVTGFVGAFSPSTLELFNRTMLDLTAVVGMALEPVLQGLTTIAKDVGALLRPIMEQLRPVFEVLAQTVIAILTPGLDNLAAVVQELVPVVVFAADILSNLGTVVRVTGAFMAGWINQLREWLSGLFGGAGDAAKSFTDGLKDAVQQIARAALLLVGYLARLLGMTGFLDGMIKSLGRTPGKAGVAGAESVEGLAAAQQGRVTNIQDFSRSIMASAFTASGGLGPAKDTNAWLQDVVGELKDIKDGNTTVIDNMIKSIEAMLWKVEKAVEENLQERFRELISMIPGSSLLTNHRPGFERP